MTREEFAKKKNNTIREGEEAMAGYDLPEGRYENRTLSDDEMWSAFSNLFSSHSKNSSSYKFGFTNMMWLQLSMKTTELLIKTK